MVRRTDEEEDMEDDVDIEEEEEKEEKTQPSKNIKDSSSKVVIIPRAVSVEEMFNVINDKLDAILSKKN